VYTGGVATFAGDAMLVLQKSSPGAAGGDSSFTPNLARDFVAHNAPAVDIARRSRAPGGSRYDYLTLLLEVFFDMLRAIGR
jgi:hypothetical protein